jgi:16S rRNA (cytosine967-C5)-methyltransferase
MRPAAHIDAAIAVLGDVMTRHRPASTALADWGKSHRFAGSGDRAAIGNLVFDALRRRASAAHAADADSPRAIVLGSLLVAGGKSADDIARLCDGSQHAPARLEPAEHAALAGATARPLPPHVAADVPEWAFPRFAALFGGAAVAAGQALAARAPVDLRCNTLKTDRTALAAALARYDVQETPLSRLGLRLAPPLDGKRQPNVEADAAHGRGWFEIQDEGSQVAAALAGVAPGETVLDLCAGAGGKTLALAAAMRNQGRIHAYDDDKLRLRAIFERLTRSGATVVDVMDGGDDAALAALGDRFDCVLVDAPCSGSGTWRRKPDAKWRLKPASLAKRLNEQRAVLATAARHVRPGGRLVYVTCSLFDDENGKQVDAFRASHPEFRLRASADAWRNASAGTLAAGPPASADAAADTLLLAPHVHGTDGFFVAVLERAG